MCYMYNAEYIRSMLINNQETGQQIYFLQINIMQVGCNDM